MKCPYCNQDHPDDFQFCPKTGKRIENQNKACTNEQCSAYGQYVLPQDAKFCPNCGCSIANETANVEHCNEDEELIFSVKDVSLSMVKVNAGSFVMGGIFKKESPMHDVTLTNNYYIGKFLVTRNLYETVMGRQKESDSIIVNTLLNIYWNDFTRWPIIVSWNDCQKFIEKLNDMFHDRLDYLGMRFRLPTESEWEYAARGGNKSNNYIYAGSNAIDEVAWFSKNSFGCSQSVGLKKPNELGLYDMSGGVGEWCYDSYKEYTSAAQINPVFIDNDLERVIRGGNCHSDCDDCRLSARAHAAPNTSSLVGLRLCLSKFEIKNQSYVKIK